MTKTIVANWKMNPASLKEARSLMQRVNKIKLSSKVSLVICPPFVHLPLLKTKFFLGAQDGFMGKSGAYTGAVSLGMLKAIGVAYVILGHSERRIYFGEKNDLIAKKISAALKEGLRPIVCVGESLSVRKKGMAAIKKFVVNQLQECLSLIRDNERSKVIVAYEPVWAISTMPGGRPDTPEEAVEIISMIKRETKGQVFYGGSVNSDNAVGFLNRQEIDGALIGGASLRPEELKTIIDSIHS